MSNQIEVISAVHGIAPRSDELLRLGGDLERGRINRAVYEDVVAQETGEWLQLQEQAGITIQEDGKLRWQDHLRPLARAATGFEPDVDNAPVTRWFEANRFYRRPSINGKLRLDFDRADAEFKGAAENISLLTPRSFAYLCTDNYPELSADRNALQLYSELLFYFERQGVKRVLLEDYLPAPLLQNGSLREAKTLAEWFPGLQISIISPGQQSGIPYHTGNKLGVSVEAGKLREICALPDYRRPNLSGSEVWHQVVDASHTRKDDLDVSTFPLDLFRTLAPARLVLTHTIDFDGNLPLISAREKVKRLGGFAADLQDYLGVNQ